MYLFFSGEIGDIDGEEFRLLRNEIVASLHFITDREKEAELMKDDTYGSEIQSIGIISMILSPRFDVHKERRLIRFKEKNADIRLKIDYQKYQTAGHQGKKFLLTKNIVDSIMVIEKRKKDDFQGERLIEDILKALNVSREELNEL